MCRRAINIPLALVVSLWCLEVGPVEAQSSVVKSAQCVANGGQRYIDSGDGTILDCNTGLLWLKDASCAGLPGSDAPKSGIDPDTGLPDPPAGKVARHQDDVECTVTILPPFYECVDLPGTGRDSRATWKAAKDVAAALANGMCGLTDGSSPGDWRLPTISEFCSAWSGSALRPCPPSAASNSLINTNFKDPAVSNATGDSQWSHDDSFVGVEEANYYWSATEKATASLKSGNVSTLLPGTFVWPVRDRR